MAKNRDMIRAAMTVLRMMLGAVVGVVEAVLMALLMPVLVPLFAVYVLAVAVRVWREGESMIKEGT
jgi:uncharacterized membrane protein YoaK (UPF0700 family)